MLFKCDYDIMIVIIYKICLKLCILFFISLYFCVILLKESEYFEDDILYYVDVLFYCSFFF